MTVDIQYIVTFDLGVTQNSLAQLPETLLAKAGDLRYDNLIKDPLKWAKAVGSGIIEGIDDVEKVLRETFKAGDAVVKEALKAVNGACSITKAMFKM